MMVPPEAEMCLWYPEDNFFRVTFARILSEQRCCNLLSESEIICSTETW
jgi:hypothetical protein